MTRPSKGSTTDPDGPDEGGGLTSRQEVVAVALASGMTLNETNRKLKVGTTTLKRWARMPQFAGRVNELRGEATARAMGRLTDAMTEAADTLRGLLKSKVENMRFCAARAVIELAVKLRENVELEARIAALEGKGNSR